jgi:hypothetical protein
MKRAELVPIQIAAQQAIRPAENGPKTTRKRVVGMGLFIGWIRQLFSQI